VVISAPHHPPPPPTYTAQLPAPAYPATPHTCPTHYYTRARRFCLVPLPVRHWTTSRTNMVRDALGRTSLRTRAPFILLRYRTY